MIDDKEMTFDEYFAEFWSLYPRRDENPRIRGRKEAYNKLQRVIKENEASWEDILSGVRLYARCDNVLGKNGDNKKFICLPITWINKARWDDEYEDTPVSPLEIAAKDRTVDQWRARFTRDDGRMMRGKAVPWSTTDDGPAPGEPGCLVPLIILKELGFNIGIHAVG